MVPKTIQCKFDKETMKLSKPCQKKLLIKGVNEWLHKQINTFLCIVDVIIPFPTNNKNFLKVGAK
jgi:hypothetical protein